MSLKKVHSPLISARVYRSKKALRIVWPNGASVSFVLKAGNVLGIGDVRCGGVLLRSPSKLWRPLVSTPDGIHYTQFALKNVHVKPDGTVVVASQAIGFPVGVQEEQDEYLGDIVNLDLADGCVLDSFEWELKPSQLTLDGHEFQGFSYRYRLLCGGDRKAYRMFDDATWEIGGHVEGNTLLLQGEVNPPVAELKKGLYFTTACNYYGAELSGIMGKPKRVSFQRLPRIGTLQAFDFLVHAKGALLGWFDPLVEVLSVVQKDDDEDVLHVLDEIRRPLSARFESDPKHMLFWPAPAAGWSMEKQRDLWTRAYDFVHEGVRRRYGVQRSPIQPRIWTPQLYRDYEPIAGRMCPRNEFLRHLADHHMKAWADMGVKEICTHSLWKSDYTEDRAVTKDMRGGLHGGLTVGSICNVRVHEISPLWGGPDALAYFVDKAHEQGIQVQLWWATHLSRRAPIFQERPDFMTMARDGLPNGGGFGHQSLITMDLNNPDCFEWFFGHMKRLHEQTGYDGLFHDSYGNMTFLPVHFQDPLRRGQQEAYGRLVHRLQDVGVKTFTVEGLGPLGVGHFGMGLLPKNGKLTRQFQCALNWWVGHEDMVYGLNFGIGAAPWTGRDPSAREFSFRCMAAGGRFGFSFHEQHVAVWTGWLRDHNRICARLGTLVGRRTLLPKDQGILWQREGDTILFAFQAFRHTVPRGFLVTGVGPDGDRPVRLNGNRLSAQPWSVYRLVG